MKKVILYIIIIVLFLALLAGIILTVALINSNDSTDGNMPATGATEYTSMVENENIHDIQTEETTTEVENNSNLQVDGQVVDSTNEKTEVKVSENMNITEPEETEPVSVESTEGQKPTAPPPLRPTGDDFGMGEF